MPLSQRSQRARVYRYNPATEDGWVTRSYTFAAEYWARLETRDVTSDNSVQGTPVAQVTHIERTTIEFHGGADVRADDVVKVAGVSYRVISVAKKIQTNELVASASSTDMDNLTIED